MSSLVQSVSLRKNRRLSIHRGGGHQGFCFLTLEMVVAYYARYKDNKESAGTDFWFYNEINELKKPFSEGATNADWHP